MRRLPCEFYQGDAFAHWSVAIRERRTGWLCDTTHAAFREAQLHSLARYSLLCAVYCLMPDHMYFVWMGVSSNSDQDRAARFFRNHMAPRLLAYDVQFQKQTWDTVLRDKDRARGAFEQLLFYVGANPVRAGLVEDAQDWPYSGALAIGLPDFCWRRADYMQLLWSTYESAWSKEVR